MNGKGGGKPESAQASGNKVSVLSEAIRIATDYANAKLGISCKSTSTVMPAAPATKSLSGAFAISYDPQAPLSRLLQAVTQMSNKSVTFTPGPPGTPLILTLPDKTQLCGLNAVATFLASEQLNGGTDFMARSQVLQWLYYAQNHLVHYVSATKGKTLVIILLV